MSDSRDLPTSGAPAPPAKVESLGSNPPTVQHAESTVKSANVDHVARADSGADSEAGAPLVPGYTPQARLGAGTFGAVWSAVQKSTGQRVAVKVLYQRSEADLRKHGA